MQNFSGEPEISCLVFGRADMARMAASLPRCRLWNALSEPLLPPSRIKFREPPFSQTDQSSFRWFGNWECNPCIRARAGMVVLTENENVADGW